MAELAAAATGWDRCPYGYFCIFEHAHGEGHYAYFSFGAENLTQPIGGFNFNDQTSSVWNRNTYWDVCFHHHINYNTPALSLGPAGPKVELGPGLNDSISSLYRFNWTVFTQYQCSGAVRITR